jgi:hypothetical protein
MGLHLKDNLVDSYLQNGYCIVKKLIPNEERLKGGYITIPK